MKKVSWILGTISGLFFTATAFALNGLESELVRSKPVSTTYLLEGVVEAELRTTISSQTSGVVEKILFDVNDFVRKDEVVVVIDNKQQTAGLKQAQAAEREARALLQEAQGEFNRIQEVYQKNVVSKAEFDRANAALKTARARNESAQAAVSKVQQQLDFTIVRAPFSGILTARMIEPGESVNVGTTLMSGVSLERLRINTQVPQSIFKAVRNHRYAIIVTEDSEIVSTAMTFFPFADPLSHSFQLRIQLPPSESDLIPGMFVKVALEVSRENKMVIPFNSVAFRGEVTGVYVSEGEALHFRHVRLGRRLAENEVVILSGIIPGDSIVSDPVAAAIAIKSTRTR
ncbi:MAG: efflux RND transporter periplasmic adaptor subunit [Gammaproteobacteria bacterium]|nr:efflux RND transporter periplasmic adaptor subunit [Gammaproteobacteria bacterium]